MTAVELLTLDDWRAMAVESYGKDPLQWQFRCISCSHVQKGADLVEESPRVMDWIFMACYGRHGGAFGCMWSLGGLLQFHHREVTGEDGDPVPVFPFAFEPVEDWEGFGGL